MMVLVSELGPRVALGAQVDEIVTLNAVCRLGKFRYWWDKDRRVWLS